MIRIGIDIGGTGIQVGVVSEDYKIIREGSIPTRKDLPFEEQVRQIAEEHIRDIRSSNRRDFRF